MPNPRAFSLLEMVVVMGLTMLIGTLLVQVLLPTMRWSARSQARGQLQESCHLALREIRGLLQRGNAASISYVNQSPTEAATVLTVQPLVLDLTTPTPSYQTELECVAWIAGQGKLQYQHWTTVPPTLGVTLDPVAPFRLDFLQLQRAATTPSPQSRLLAQDVVEFSLSSPADPPNVGNPFKVRLVLQRHVAAGDSDKCALEQWVFLNNQP